MIEIYAYSTAYSTGFHWIPDWNGLKLRKVGSLEYWIDWNIGLIRILEYWNIALDLLCFFFPGMFFCAKGLDQFCFFGSLLLCTVVFVLRRNNDCLPSAHVDCFFVPNCSTKMTTLLFSVQHIFVSFCHPRAQCKTTTYSYTCLYRAGS